MRELVRKRKEKEAQEAEAARLLEEKKQRELEEHAISVRIEKVRGKGTPLWRFSISNPLSML